MEEHELAQVQQLELPDLFVRAEHAITRNYLMTLSNDIVINACDEKTIKKLPDTSKLLLLDRLVYNKEENNLQKLTTVYAAAHAAGANLSLVLHSDGQAVELYLGVMDMGVDADAALQTLYGALKSNFPGSLGKSYTDLCLKDTPLNTKFDEWFEQQGKTIVSVSAIPSIRSEQVEDNARYVQGLEKVIDAMQGTPFTMLVLARNVSGSELSEIKAEYETLYSNLSPYAKSVLSYGVNQSEGISRSLSSSFTNSVGEAQSQTLAVGRSRTETHTEGTSSTDSTSVGAYAGVQGKGVGGGVSTSYSRSRTKSTSDAVSIGTSETKSDTVSHDVHITKGVSAQEGTSITIGSSSTHQLEYHNKTIEELLKQIDVQLQRIQDSENYGMFGTAAYFLAPDIAKAQAAASAYRAVISGRNSHIAPPQINVWDSTICKSRGQTEMFTQLKSSLRCLRHPVFQLENGEFTTPATLISGQELAIAMGLPQKSVSGLPVIETVPFGRNVSLMDGRDISKEKKICLGNIYHMWAEENTPVPLRKKSLAAHTFVTGSTGAGKSNTVYHLIQELTKDNSTQFMIVEPAKGEYKDVFGGRDNVTVYSINPKKSKLLCLNPFAFPSEEISVTEHLDRLVEIFNACWPMYAAMPAILKDACQRAYIAVGWNMESSENRRDPLAFPTFSEVLEQVRQVVNESEYSSDNKSDYTGALVTRLHSLTTGIYGSVFTNDPKKALSGKALFDDNVIIDLSRVGSSETKALIMGFLVMQLQEYRMANTKKANSDLRHITVLEEAHNLLRATTTSQGEESANLAGKSVEMLSNAIAEMRTYGEGFIIVDQAPGLMDMSVIRNTNTKIIMRLPDESDRELVGKAAGLRPDQIAELAKLPMGVAAVYQNDWLEPVLCKVPEFPEKAKNPYLYLPPKSQMLTRPLQKFFTAQCTERKVPKLSSREQKDLQAWCASRTGSEYTMSILEEGIFSLLSDEKLGILCYNLFDGHLLCQKVAALDLSQSEQPQLTEHLCDYGLDDSLAKSICEKCLDAALALPTLPTPALRLRVEELCKRKWL